MTVDNGPEECCGDGSKQALEHPPPNDFEKAGARNEFRNLTYWKPGIKSHHDIIREQTA